ncbi:hypothetical protein SCAR479_04817 [Seiridium cardinale]|uniref:lytic cellulose monooxygenase (C4-dehydrogenating) n=1 Tax=Seiridium cardinale TaxID=138064 RepID=A0ABR2XXL2_9PEZI
MAGLPPWPIIDYLAPCNGPCETVDKTSLKFFKIDGAGKADPSATSSPGYWANDIPASVTPGNYVLRHEIIALHSANQPNGARAYPQCFNLEITGSGADTPSGIPGTQLYNSVDPGILYNLYTTPQPSYTVPGPPLVAGASSSVSQSSSRITASTTATVGHTSTTSSQTSPTSSSAAPSTPSTSSTAKRLTSSVQSTSSSAGVSTSSPPATTSKTSTTSSSSTAAMASSSLVPLYGLEG